MSHLHFPVLSLSLLCHELSKINVLCVILERFTDFVLHPMFSEVWKSYLSPPIPSRFHGSYERLWAGQVSEALVDLTGGLAEHWSLGNLGSEEQHRPEEDSDNVRRKRLDLNLLYPVKEDCVLSCSTHSSPAGREVLTWQIKEDL